jgi:hypothetical protein
VQKLDTRRLKQDLLDKERKGKLIRVETVPLIFEGTAGIESNKHTNYDVST